MTLIDEIKEVFLTEFGIPADEFSSSLAYGSIPEWDSASHMVIITALEERFDIMFDPDEVVELSTVDQIEAALKAKGVA
jgi:acyl carrier protein